MGYRNHSDSIESGEASVGNHRVQAVYGPDDLEKDPARDGAPGQFPFTRGIFDAAERPRAWRSEHYAGFGRASDARERMKYLREIGSLGGASIALDLPTQLGLDSDDPMAKGEVGHVGVALDTVADLEELFSDIPLSEVGRIFTTANSIAPIFMAMVIVLAEKQGEDPSSFTVQIQNDSLKEYFARGTQILEPKDALRLSVDAIEYCTLHYPEWSPLSISGAHMRGAGATAVQELAFAISDGVAYVQAMVERGHPVDTFAHSLELHFAIQMDVLSEAARLRAARRIWAHIMRDRFGAVENDSMAAWITTATSGITLTAQEPINNVVRTTVETMAAILGGANNHRIASYDEAVGIPTREAARVAVRIPQILVHEAGLSATADPLGGSYYVEALTDEIENEFWREFQEIESRGGALACIDDGYFLSEIVRSARAQQRGIEDGTQPIVGLNAFLAPDGEERELEVFEVDPTAESTQVHRLRRVREERDEALVANCLRQLRSDVRARKNVLPATIECVRVYVTVGEIVRVWREELGEWSDTGRLV